jgi:hypothetical protein
MTLERYKLKPEHEIEPGASILVEPGTLHLHVDNPGHWELVGRTLNPNALQMDEVLRQGFASRRSRIVRQVPVHVRLLQFLKNKLHWDKFRGLVEREGSAGSCVLTDQGRAVFGALLADR